MESKMESKQVIKGPEVFIGIVAPVGIELSEIILFIEDTFKELNYKSEVIRLSKLISEIPRYNKLNSFIEGPEDIRIEKHMDAGDHLRKTTNLGNALIHLALLKIKEYRKIISGNRNKAVERQAYIFNSLKHPKEVEALRKVYGKSFLLFSIYSPRSNRVDLLAEKISKSRGEINASKYRDIAEKLVQRDTDSGEKHYGQNVGETFPLGDVFINSANLIEAKTQVKRAIETWFGYPFHTPNKDEYGMFHAKAASLRSADLSRQVGAVITNDEGDILSTGCNEVPKYLGGAIWEGDKNDFRDFVKGLDFSAKYKEEIITEILCRFKDEHWLSSNYKDKSLKQLLKEALYDEDGVLKGTRVTNIIEYGRIVHAEMFAITEAARKGVSIKNSTLYCTTFPCHMCARHIISAGIKRVVFIEPYPKSLAKVLYEDIVEIELTSKSCQKVKFEPFVGIAPSKYFELFSMKKRKDDRGKVVKWNKQSAFPESEQYYNYFIESEHAFINTVQEFNSIFGYSKNDEKPWKN